MTPWWGSLLFVITGALLSAMTAYLLQRQRRKQERKDRLADSRREALSVALEWVAPLDHSLSMIEILMRNLLNRSESLQDFSSGFSSNVSDLRTLRSSANQRLVLETDPYPLLEQLRTEIHQLRKFAVDLWRESEGEYKPNREQIVEQSLETSTLKVRELRERVETVRQRLVEDYRKTYD